MMAVKKDSLRDGKSRRFYEANVHMRATAVQMSAVAVSAEAKTYPLDEIKVEAERSASCDRNT